MCIDMCLIVNGSIDKHGHILRHMLSYVSQNMHAHSHTHVAQIPSWGGG